MKNLKVKRSHRIVISILLSMAVMCIFASCGNQNSTYKVKYYQEDSIFWYVVPTAKGDFYHSSPAKLNDFSDIKFSYTEEHFPVNKLKYLYTKNIDESKLPDYVLTEIEMNGRRIENP
jgi:hypothetical protein